MVGGHGFAAGEAALPSLSLGPFPVITDKIYLNLMCLKGPCRKMNLGKIGTWVCVEVSCSLDIFTGKAVILRKRLFYIFPELGLTAGLVLRLFLMTGSWWVSAFVIETCKQARQEEVRTLTC